MTLDLFQKEEQHTNGPVTVLGKTFANDEERRTYFREELRKKLPELKEIEGFPIGEDEDIVNLSDPPFYTACPNPWINDFVAEWEEEKKQLEKEGKRVPDFEVTEPYAADVSEGKNNPIYNAHSYHTKVPHPAIMRYIMHYTQPGDVVFDGFAGTGMTGVAASMCANPDADIKTKIEKENPNAKWGKRNAICGDLSPVASLISGNYNTKKNPEDFAANFFKIISDIESKYEWVYKTKHNDSFGIIDNVIWSDVFLCNNCNKDVVFYEVAVIEEDGKVLKDFDCPHCSSKLTKKGLLLNFESKFDPLTNTIKKYQKKIPVVIKYTYDKKKYSKKVDEYVIEILNKIQSTLELKNIQIERMPLGKEARRNDKSGIEYVHEFYFARTILLIDELLNNINSKEGLLLVNSQLTNLSLLNRHRPGVSFPYNPLSGTLYIGSQISESNVFTAYKNKIKSFIKAFNLLKENQITYTSSASDLYITDESIDYVFTDPPFGANISYSELNFISETFLKVKTNFEIEAIENSGRNQSLLRYNQLMLCSFKEYYRILKPGKWMTVEFSNTSAAVWNGIQNSIQQAGFIITNVSGLDKQLGSFKAVTTTTAVKQDLVISCYKPSSEFDTKFQESQHSPIGVWDFVEEHLSHLPIHLVKDNATTAVVERSAKILFDRLIAFYVQRSLPVPIDAGKFQEGLKERFVERDGMYFTQEQVEEYERKKAEVPEFIQMSLFVSSEQDAVYWLRQLLDKEPKTEQDLNPLWMREVAGNMRKGDTLPEMRQILEENFLKDDSGKWYVPDAENEADLEKLRNKRLLKIFEDYKTEAAKPKGKLKEVRVEALRVGFKQCYQDKDFKTIVSIGDRIPNNLLMEDEVLLQFYDIASAKI